MLAGPCILRKDLEPSRMWSNLEPENVKVFLFCCCFETWRRGGVTCSLPRGAPAQGYKSSELPNARAFGWDSTVWVTRSGSIWVYFFTTKKLSPALAAFVFSCSNSLLQAKQEPGAQSYLQPEISPTTADKRTFSSLEQKRCNRRASWRGFLCIYSDDHRCLMIFTF